MARGKTLRIFYTKGGRWEGGTPLAHLYASPPGVEPAVTFPALSLEAFDSVEPLPLGSANTRANAASGCSDPREASSRRAGNQRFCSSTLLRLPPPLQSSPARQWFFFKWLPRALPAYMASIRPSISPNWLDSPTSTQETEDGPSTALLDVRQLHWIYKKPNNTQETKTDPRDLTECTIA